jgi:hypothetical protein
MAVVAVPLLQATKRRHIMVTDDERNKLVNEYGREPVSAARLLLTCAAGLLIVVALAWIGFDIHTFSVDSPGQVHKAQVENPAP